MSKLDFSGLGVDFTSGKDDESRNLNFDGLGLTFEAPLVAEPIDPSEPAPVHPRRERREAQRTGVVIDNEPDPFEGESLGSLSRRRGQQVAAGATDVFASVPEGVAISEADFGQNVRDQAPEHIREAMESVKRLRVVLDGGLSPISGKPLSNAERETFQARHDAAMEAILNWQDVADAEVKPASDRAMFKIGDQIRNASGDVFGKPDERDRSWWGQAAYGLGNMAGYIAGSAVTGPFAPATGAFLGSSQNASALYKEALEAGADEETAREAANWGRLVGASEVIPLIGAFKLLPPSLRRRVTNRFIRAGSQLAIGAAEEGVQEGAAQIANNLIASGLYDPDRGWNEGLVESMTVGAFLGTVLRGPAAIGEVLSGDSEPLQPATAPQSSADTIAPAVPPTALQRPAGAREAAAQAPVTPPTPEDEASPIPTDLIQDGKRALQDAGATNQANDILARNGLPGVNQRVAVNVGGQPVEGTVVDAYSVENLSTGMSADGAVIRLDDGRIVDEMADTLSKMGAVPVRGEQTLQEAPVQEGASVAVVDETTGAAQVDVTPETFEAAKAQRDRIQAEVDAASKALRSYARADNGLTPDEVKATPEWQSDKTAYDMAFARLQAFNQAFTKRFSDELRAERDAKVSSTEPLEAPAQDVERAVDVRIAKDGASLDVEQMSQDLGMPADQVRRALDQRAAFARGIRKTGDGKYRRIPKRGPMTLTQFVAATGGVRDDEGHSLHRNVYGGKRKFMPGLGPVIRSAGNSLDRIGELAVSRGYFKERPTESELIDALDEEERGRPRYSEEDRAEVDKRMAADTARRQSELESADARAAAEAEGRGQRIADMADARVAVLAVEKGGEAESDPLGEEESLLPSKYVQLAAEMVYDGAEPIDAFQSALSQWRRDVDMKDIEAGFVVPADIPFFVEEESQSNGAEPGLQDGAQPDPDGIRPEDGAQTSDEGRAAGARAPGEGGRGAAESDGSPEDDGLDGLFTEIADEVAPAQSGASDSGPFGPVRTFEPSQWREAVSWLQENRTGDARGALSHPDIGSIDLVWGKEPTGADEGFGLAKIAVKHPEVLSRLGDIIPEMEVASRSKNRVRLASDEARAVVRLDWDGEGKTWLLTAFEIGPRDAETTDTDTVTRGGDTALSPTEADTNIGSTRPNVNDLPTEGPVETTLGTAEQTLIPGAERSARQAAQARDGRLKGSKPQKAMDEGLFGTPDTTGDMFDAPKPEAKPKAPRQKKVTYADAPTWAEVLAAAPTDSSSKAGHKDTERLFGMMQELTGRRISKWMDLSPQEQIELFEMVKASNPDPQQGDTDAWMRRGVEALLSAAGPVRNKTVLKAISEGETDSSIAKAFAESVNNFVGSTFNRGSTTLRGTEMEILYPDEGGAPKRSSIKGAELGKLLRETVEASPRDASEAAKSAVKNAAMGLDDVAKGLTELFGGGKTLGSGPAFDEDTYRKALPFFKAGVAHFRDAGVDVADIMRALVRHLVDKAGMDRAALENMRPYVVRFTRDVRDGKVEIDDVSGTGAGVERDSGNADARDGLGDANVSASTDRAQRGAGTRAGADGEGTGLPEAGGGLFADDAFGVGGGSDTPTQGGTSSDVESSGRVDAAGSGDPDVERVSNDRIGTDQTRKSARKASDVTDRRAVQAAADRIPVKPGDPDNIEQTLPLLQPPQRQDVLKAERRFEKHHGMLFTNGTGTGKTYTGLGVVKRMVQQGKSNILIIAPNDGIIDQWIAAGEDIGVPIARLPDTKSAGKGVSITTYANAGENRHLAERQWDLVVADESQYLSQNHGGDPTAALTTLRAITNRPKNLRDRAEMMEREYMDELNALWAIEKRSAAQEARREELISGLNDVLAPHIERFEKQPRSKVVFLSATPFAHVPTVDYAEGYLFDYPEREATGYNQPDGKQDFFIQHFGYRMRTGKLTKPDGSVNSEVLERDFHSWLEREGALSGRQLEVDADYDRKFVLVEDAVGQKIDEALKFLDEAEDGRYRPIAERVAKSFDYLSRRYLLEAIKARKAIPIIQKHLDLGRKVVVFHDYNKGGGFSPFAFDFAPDYTETVNTPEGPKEVNIHDLYQDFLRAMPEVKKLDFSKFNSPITTLTKAFPSALLYNGTVSRKERAQAKKLFNEDGSGRDVIIVQSDAGSAGLSIHDTTGKHMRALVNLGMPNKPTTTIQAEGRIYRVGQVSDAAFRYMNTGTNWERWTFAQSIAERAGTAENLALGTQARALKQSFIDAFLESDEYPPGAEDGKGGKERDRADNNHLTEFERAKTYYFTQQKRDSRTKSREGNDYFATPEPLGLKMVEWANIRFGEKVLEPSAGHGAIARFIPEGAIRTLIEPSSELASRAALASPGANVRTHRFEDLNIVNKYDVIVMNPPFGTGGKLAYEHLQKATRHLRNGGRIVAIVPRGPAADKRWTAFLENEDNADIHTVGNFEMPAVTFERAGTKVATRILILEKQTDADSAAQIQTSTRSYDNASTINEFFDRIEGAGVRDRVEPVTKDIDLVPENGEVTAGGHQFRLHDELRGDRQGDGYETVYGAQPKRFMGKGPAFATPAKLAEQKGGYWHRAGKMFIFKTPGDRMAWLEALERGDQPKRVEITDADMRIGAVVSTGIFQKENAWHAKRAKNVVNVTLQERVDRDRYFELAALAKENGGYYSRYDKAFQFTTDDQADAFIAAASRSEADKLSIPRGPSRPEDRARLGTPRQRDAANALIGRVQSQLDERLKEYGFSDRVVVKVGAYFTGARSDAIGRYLPRERMIQVAAGVLQDSREARRVFDHEVIHALRDLGVIRPAEWRVLSDAVQKDEARIDEVRERYQGRQLSENGIIEEAVADAFSDWQDGRMVDPPGALRRAFERILSFLRALLGRQSAEDVFRAIAAGEIGARGGQGESARRADAMSDRWAVGWHGSPYDFDAFTTKAIGTGEGAGAFGWGLYFASKREVAEYYRESLANDGSGRLYRVNLTPSEESYLLWDKPLSEQSEKVRGVEWEALLDPDDFDEITNRLGWAADWNELTGENIYTVLAFAAESDMLEPNGPGVAEALDSGDIKRAASLFLRNEAIPGIKYLDGNSRVDGRDSGTYNYVIFDEGSVEIEEKFALRRKRDRSGPDGKPAGFAKKETEERWQQARKGVAGAQSWYENAKAWAADFADGFTNHWRNLPLVPQFSDVREQLRKLEAAPEAATEQTLRVLRDITKDMTPGDLDLFTRKAILEDLRWEAENERALPFGYESLAEVEADLDAVNAQMQERPHLIERTRLRKMLVQEVARQMIDSGLLSQEQVQNPAYFRHQVLEYAAATRGTRGTAERLRSPKWQKRKGSHLDINANYLEAEFEWMQRALTDIATLRTIQWIRESSHNQRAQTVQAAKDHNQRLIDTIIQADMKANGYTTSTGRQTSPINEIWVGFKQRIAVGMKGVEDALDSGLRVPPHLSDAVRAVAAGYSETDIFPLMAWMVDNETVGAAAAASVFKTIADRKAWTKDILGEKFADPMNIDELIRRGFAPEGHVAWQPDEGNLLFTSKTISEHVVDRFLEQSVRETGAQMGIPADQVRAAFQTAKDMLVVGPKRYQMVIPQELADTLNQIREPWADNWFLQLFRKPQSWWKQWILINPRRWFRYNLNNMSGDLDAVIAGNPRVFRKMGAAWREMWRVMVKKEAPSDRYIEAMERGVFTSGLSVQEIQDINDLAEFETLMKPLSLSRPDRLARAGFVKAWRVLRGSTNFRENWVRFAAYLDYIERIEKGESQRSIGYGASLPEMVDAVTDKKDRAALLARELIGDYGAVSVYGQQMRQYVIPFYSWLEINTKRYKRLIGNAFGQGIGAGMKQSGILGATLGVRTSAYLAVRMVVLYMAINAWNHLFFPDEEEELSELDQKRLHVILGRDDDGEIVLLRLQGAFSDFLSWFGFPDVVGVFDDVQRGRATAGDMLQEIAKAPVNRVLGGVTPVVKLPVELATGQTYWPDVFEPRTIRDRMRHAMRLFSLEHEYDQVSGNPTRGYGRSVAEAFINFRDPGEAAYNDMLSAGYEWINKQRGTTSRGSYITDRGQALYNFKKALRFGDDSAVEAARDAMRDLRMSAGDIRASIKRAHPLSMVPIKARPAYLRSLSPDERDRLQRAIQWYGETFLSSGQQ